MLLVRALTWNAHRKHKVMEEEALKEKVFNLEAVESIRDSVEKTFEHMGFLLKEIREALDKTLN